MRKTISIGIGAATILASAAIGVAAASASSAAGTAGTSPAAVSVTTVNPGAVSPAATRITATRARQIALAAVPGSRFVQIESDDLHDRPVWKVTVATSAGRTVVTVDARTGAVISKAKGGKGHGDDGIGHDNDAVGHDTVTTVTIARVPAAVRHNDDGARHDVGDDRGGNRGDNHGDDHGGNRGDDHGHGGHGNDDGPGHH